MFYIPVCSFYLIYLLRLLRNTLYFILYLVLYFYYICYISLLTEKIEILFYPILLLLFFCFFISSQSCHLLIHNVIECNDLKCTLFIL